MRKTRNVAGWMCVSDAILACIGIDTLRIDATPLRNAHVIRPEESRRGYPPSRYAVRHLCASSQHLNEKLIVLGVLAAKDRRTGCAGTSCSEQLHLIEGASFRLLLRTPSQELSAMAKPTAGHMIVLHFADEDGIKRLPFGGTGGGPTARPSRRAAAESSSPHERFHHPANLFFSDATE
jgi:hypothetical protein